MLDCRRAWGQDRVYFTDVTGRLVHLPASWTDVVEPDPFVVVAAGRSSFRLNDLLRLAALVARLSE